MKIIVSMRDEAHRFSRRLHHHAESKRIFKSWVDDIKGLNKETKENILRVNTLSISELKKMKGKDIQDFFGLNPKQANLIYKYFQTKDD